MAFGQGILSGKKTYVVATLGLLSAVGGYLYGEVDLKGLIEAVFVAIGAITLKAGNNRIERKIDGSA